MLHLEDSFKEEQTFIEKFASGKSGITSNMIFLEKESDREKEINALLEG